MTSYTHFYLFTITLYSQLDCHMIQLHVFGPENGSPTATNIVVVLDLVGVLVVKIFKSLKLFRFSTDRN